MTDKLAPEPSGIIPMRPVDAHGGQRERQSLYEGMRSAFGKKVPKPPPRESVSDVALVMGIPPDEMTDNVQEALTLIMNEFDHQRVELDHLKGQVAYLEELADGHSFLPVRNRRALSSELARIMNLAQRSDLTVTFLYILVKNLEEIRRTKGRRAVEAVLIQVSKLIKDSLRASDSVGYLDGNDFGVILPLAGGGDALGKANAIAATIKNSPVNWKRGQLVPQVETALYTVSEGDNLDTVIDAAEGDLRRKNGR